SKLLRSWQGSPFLLPSQGDSVSAIGRDPERGGMAGWRGVAIGGGESGGDVSGCGSAAGRAVFSVLFDCHRSRNLGFLFPFSDHVRAHCLLTSAIRVALFRSPVPKAFVRFAPGNFSDGAREWRSYSTEIEDASHNSLSSGHTC